MGHAERSVPQDHCESCLLVCSGTEVVKLAVPIGTWAIKQGFRVARDLMFDTSDGRKPTRKVTKNRDEDSK